LFPQLQASARQPLFTAGSKSQRFAVSFVDSSSIVAQHNTVRKIATAVYAC
jgi:hypothetical protein